MNKTTTKMKVTSFQTTTIKERNRSRSRFLSSISISTSTLIVLVIFSSLASLGLAFIEGLASNSLESSQMSINDSSASSSSSLLRSQSIKKFLVKRSTADRHHQPFASLLNPNYSSTSPSSAVVPAAESSEGADNGDNGSNDNTGDENSYPNGEDSELASGANENNDDNNNSTTTVDYDTNEESSSTTAVAYDNDPPQIANKPTTAGFRPVTSEAPTVALRPSRQSSISATTMKSPTSISSNPVPRNTTPQPQITSTTTSESQSSNMRKKTTQPTTTLSSPSTPINTRVLNEQAQQGDPQAARTFNLNMGADRLLIKQQPNNVNLMLNSPTAISTTAKNNYDREEVATESINYELLATSSPTGNGYGASNQAPNGSAATYMNTNQRRQDLLYPSSSLNNNQDINQSRQQQMIPSLNTRMSQHHHHHQLHPSSSEQQQQQQLEQNICYTPISLVMVILITMMITIIVCFCTHVLIKHLKRHQFDLIENSKHFNHNLSGHLNSGYLQQQGAPSISTNRGHQQQALQLETSTFPIGYNCPPSAGPVGSLSSQNKKSYLLNLFKGAGGGGGGSSSFDRSGAAIQAATVSPTHDCAFDNPYFKDDAGYARRREKFNSNSNSNKQQQLFDSSQGLLLTTTTTTTSATPATGQQNGFWQPTTEATGEIHYHQRHHKQPQTNEQLDFIEHHISNLHNRQVTSSVKELTIFGNNVTGLAQQQQQLTGEGGLSNQVVDLTDEDQRARILANSKEGGGLIAVDITGHDFIGLGFDICGDQNEGIIVKSVLNSGPAKESGCIEAGDKIKCLNISFDNVTLQDAYDLLNCGSPYKMRLLIEKQAMPVMSKQFDKLRSTLVLRANQGNNLMKQNKLASNLNSQEKQPIAKNYLKRITKLVSPNGAGNNVNNFTQQQCATGSEMMFDPSTMYLGSAAARKHSSTQGYVINKAYQDNEDEHDYNYRANNTSANNHNINPQQQNANKHHQIISSTTAFDHDDDEDDDDDDDDDFKNVKHPTQNHIDLRMASSEEPVNMNNKININRRQSSNDCVNINKKQDRLKRIQDQHLEQTQSQPEIASSRLESNVNTNTTTTTTSNNNRGGAHVRVPDSSSLENNNEPNYRMISRKDNNDKLVNSMSTPIMNLLAHQADQQQQQPFDSRRVSSRRKKLDSTEQSIKEELATSDTSFIDSTSKLVGDKRKQQSSADDF